MNYKSRKLNYELRKKRPDVAFEENIYLQDDDKRDQVYYILNFPIFPAEYFGISTQLTMF